MKISTKRLLLIGVGLLGGFIAAQEIANTHAEDEGIDDDNPYIEKDSKDVARRADYEALGNSIFTQYGAVVKPMLDKVLSFGGFVVLSPLMLCIGIAIMIDDPGPVFFTQKRVGKDKSFFMLHKYRTMKMSTPHDVPTHQLENPEQCITRVGGFLRKTSLDELPQIWDIFRGKMSVIGPRPALWNQEDLVAERDKWDANSILPGLTGLAQIKGRDELFILDKAKLDGEYTAALKKGGMEAFFFDIKLLFNTVASVLRRDGVVEGGTGRLLNSFDNCQTKVARGRHAVDPADAGFEDYGCYKNFNIDKNRKVKVLITGAGSYIGESFTDYCSKHYRNIEITTIDMVEEGWRDADFTFYDTVFHVAGIAHADVGKVSLEQQKKYYDVNSTLAIETAEKAKEAGVKQFIFMSSMIVYGGAEYVDEYTVPHPVNFYGDSKWHGDVGVRKLGNDGFHVAVLRAPMLYGKGSKGNYPKLAKVAKFTSIFPDYENKRSMLYIENLCEFVALLIFSGADGIYFPQNNEYTKTSEMIKAIAAVNNKKVKTIRLINPVVSIAKKLPGRIGNLTGKAFGNFYYAHQLSVYNGLDYAKVGFKQSIKRTEGRDDNP